MAGGDGVRDGGWSADLPMIGANVLSIDGDEGDDVMQAESSVRPGGAVAANAETEVEVRRRFFQDVRWVPDNIVDNGT